MAEPNSEPRPQRKCQDVSIRVNQLNPRVILALDRTASMFAPREGKPDTLMESTQRVLREMFVTYYVPILFGYVEFPSRNCSADSCCASQITPPSRQLRSLIEQSWRCDSTDGTGVCQKSSESAPASVALWKAWNHFRRQADVEASRHVFLITDSEPTCTVQGVDECQDTKETAADLGQLDVRTVVLGLSETLRDNQCLDSVAVLGGAAAVAPMPAHIVATDTNGLRAALKFALDEIAEEACTFRLSDSLDVNQRLGVWFNEDEFVPEDDSRTDGWSFETGSRSTFTVYGHWCDKLRTSQVLDWDAFVCED